MLEVRLKPDSICAASWPKDHLEKNGKEAPAEDAGAQREGNALLGEIGAFKEAGKFEQMARG